MDTLNEFLQGMSDVTAAKFLGVHIGTLRKWRKGERVPNAGVLRFVEVLQLLKMIDREVYSTVEQSFTQ